MYYCELIRRNAHLLFILKSTELSNNTNCFSASLNIGAHTRIVLIVLLSLFDMQQPNVSAEHWTYRYMMLSLQGERIMREKFECNVCRAVFCSHPLCWNFVWHLFLFLHFLVIAGKLIPFLNVIRFGLHNSNKPNLVRAFTYGKSIVRYIFISIVSVDLTFEFWVGNPFRFFDNVNFYRHTYNDTYDNHVT